MGCDIHGVVEWKPTDPAYGGRWVTVRPLPNFATRRNYGRFGALAGVRGSGGEAHGIPEDVSDTARFAIDEIDGDGHSHSYLPLPAALMIFMGTEDDAIRSAKPTPMGDDERSKQLDYDRRMFHTCPEYLYFGIENVPPRMAEMRIVFWFDN